LSLAFLDVQAVAKQQLLQASASHTSHMVRQRPQVGPEQTAHEESPLLPSGLTERQETQAEFSLSESTTLLLTFRFPPELCFVATFRGLLAAAEPVNLLFLSPSVGVHTQARFSLVAIVVDVTSNRRCADEPLKQ
jgi:hypothetical protein